MLNTFKIDNRYIRFICVIGCLTGYFFIFLLIFSSLLVFFYQLLNGSEIYCEYDQTETLLSFFKKAKIGAQKFLTN